MKIMVTGATGFLGSRLAARCRAAYDVLAPTRQELDLTGPALEEAVVRQHPQVIFHCAAVSDIGETARDPQRSQKVNVEVPLRLAHAAQATGAKLLLCSSDQVYCTQCLPGQAECDFLLPRHEGEELSPLPLYGQQKLLAEQRCLAVCPDAVALRLSWMYAPLTPAEQARGKGTLTGVLLRALEEHRRTGAPVPVVFSATDYRGVTDADEVVERMLDAILLPGGAYNFGSPNTLSMAETVERVLHRLGITGLQVQPQNGSLRNLTMDQTKLNAAGISFTETGEALAAWLEKHL